jgi:hypothetical protein
LGRLPRSQVRLSWTDANKIGIPTTKQKYQLNVARNLYYQNLDNNLGALLRLIDEAELT